MKHTALKDVSMFSALSLALVFGLGSGRTQAGDGCEAKASSSASTQKPSCASGTETAASACKGKKDIVETAISAGSFSTLVAAVKAAGLVDTLKGNGPFTVFAPTDEAFQKLPAGTVEALLKDIPKLKSILLYHVVPGKVAASDVLKAKDAKTAQGQFVRFSAKDGVKVDGAKVVKADIDCTNGVIHVIDSVILPAGDVVETAMNAGSFKTLLAAVEAAGLTDTLRRAGPYTVFAPTDDAFAKLPAGTVEALLNDVPRLKSILLYHVVPGKVTADQVTKLTEAVTAQGQKVAITVADGVKVGGARVLKTDITTGNGVIHVIDSVILPQ